MDEVKDFESFYSIKLQPCLNEIREKDNQAEKWDIIMSISAVATLAFFGCYFIALMGTDGILLGFISLVIFIVSVYNYAKRDDLFNEAFKEKIIRQIANYLLPGVNYQPTGFVTAKEYKYSGLYRRRYDDLYGDDFVEGIYKNVSFHCSELQTEINENRRRPIIIFKGLFFVANVRTHLTGATYIWARGNEQLGVSVADERYRLFGLPKVYGMNMQNPLFEEYFSVYSTDPHEARSVLTNEMMNAILKFRQQIQRAVSLSFVAGHCYVAIPIMEDLLEASDKDMEDKEEIKKYFFTFLLIFSIINQLQLNRLV